EVLPDPGLAGVEWHCLQIEGPFDFDERGVLASVVDPLAHAGVSVFVVATYDTDYLLVTDIDGARRALLAAGHEIRPAVTDAGTRPSATEGGHR
ncbi:MAG TPA: ACT domain-containing protein, partial [Pseudonocardia sp.]|nr:ACT domain-containing protein [Pseudonocardia sp.]